MLARRRFLHGMGLAAAALAVAAVDAKVPKNRVQTLAQRLAGIERGTGGRLGVTLLDGSGAVLGGQRQDERFPMCSTFKFVLAAAVLQRVDRGELSLQQRLPIRAADMLSHAPVTERHVGGTLSVAELCRATMLFSDNPAANLLFPLVGDPPGLTRFLRTFGDAQTRSDRHEPEMNRFAADDPRDTTTPAAMAATLRTLLLGDVLRPVSRQRLSEWMIDNRTGDACLRAGLPRGWKIGDKTGSNGTDTRNDIAIVWPPGRRTPLLLTAYLNGAKVDDAARDAALKAVAVVVCETLAV
ncbi:class A beta-lactamase [Xanthomonas cerealis]|uniref:Beta-lactamase n=1 Tax=Xanthomonas cerealis pv. cerealis TaxID=152263 RepID=A0A514E9A6_9XANT|nr:class A beta-lactamase [Xanthomonas translucens]QDI02609.1 class A beta-lactamase [Xanthomonas translucens pv. cerealis]UKE47992.1 class A beta-lactamase [Xanthomonas translucens pv. cerealis]UKE70386.1 class A beta-lactamase [Xanthomonas translucens pv. pistacia]